MRATNRAGAVFWRAFECVAPDRADQRRPAFSELRDFVSCFAETCEQEGSIASDWGVSENNRKAKFYKLTASGRRQFRKETREWEQATAILERFLGAAQEQA
jgi:hypothetical protein